jgi:hypothetical protein
MTVNISLENIINKDYDLSQYQDLIDIGLFTKDQVKSILIIKDIQENNILLSNNEKYKIKQYINKFKFEPKEIEYNINYKKLNMEPYQINNIEDKIEESSESEDYSDIELITIESSKDMNVLTCKLDNPINSNNYRLKINYYN